MDSGGNGRVEREPAETIGVAIAPTCPSPAEENERVVMAHGGGGTMTQRLIRDIVEPAFRNPHLAPLHDGAVLPCDEGRWAMTTDTYVVQPLFFPGGDIGSLAVHGTVNDLAMCGAEPRWLSAAFLLEEGLPVATFARIVRSMRDAAAEAGVEIVTGDTKVVERGRGDGLYVNTAGIGIVPAGVEIDPRAARPGDVIVLSGPIGRHGIAVLSVREGLEFEGSIESDSAALHGMTRALLAACPGGVHVLRDATRGGVAAVLNEIAASAGCGIEIEEPAVPVPDAVRGACELLGFDPLAVANEGVFLAVIREEFADRAIASLRGHPLGGEAVRIGSVVAAHPGTVLLHTGYSTHRILSMPRGEQLPRIC
jgi:hydrogenase expression/formation protein HypE